MKNFYIKNAWFTTAFAIIMLSGSTVFGQSTANYTCDLTNVTGSLTDMSTGTTDLLATGTYRSNVASAVVNIGFIFYYMSTPYTQFSINSNGQLRLGGTVIPGAAQSPALSTAILAPISGSNSIQTTGKVHYKVTGTAPNQILIVEWLDLRIPASSAAGTLSRMQLLLYETSGKIEYIYGSMFNNSTAQTRSIYFSSSNIDNTVGWIGAITTTPTYNTTAAITPTSLTNNAVINNLNSAADGSRRVFSFTPPPAPTGAPTWAGTPITQVTTSGMTLNWNDNSSDETGFVLFNSLDDVTYTYFATAPAGSSTYRALGLTPSTLYYWKVAAINEGGASAYTISSSQATTATSTFTSIASGNWSSGTTWDLGVVPEATDDVIVDVAHTVIIDAPGMVAKTLTVNGSLTYHATTVGALAVSGNVTVSATGSFTSPSSGTIVNHALGISGDLTVDGTFDMNVFSTAAVVVTFTGATNNVLDGTGSTINFYSLIVNKGLAITHILDVTSVVTIVPPVSDGIRLTINNGTFKLSSASSLSPYYGTQAVCQGTGRLWINHASALVQRVGSGTSPVAGRPFVYGTLQIDAGTFAYGSGNDLFITQGTVIMGGPNAVMNIYGGFCLSAGSKFTMTDGNVNIYQQAANNSTGSGLYFETAFAGVNIFSFTGGNITIVDPSTNSAAVTVNFTNSYPGNVTFTLNGGTIRLGDGASDKAGNLNGFQINSANYYFGNVIVNNNPASVLTTRIVKLYANTTINGNLTINSGTANQFLLNGKVLTMGGNIVNSGTFSGDANAADAVTFNGSAQQVISGTGIFTNGNIRNITLNSTSVSSPSVDLQVNLSVSNGLTLTNGTLGTTKASVFTIGRSASSATFVMTRSGGSLSLTPTFALGGVTTINYYYPAPVPAAATTTDTELPASTNLTTLYIQNVSGVTLDKAVSCNTLSLTGILNTSSTNTMTVLGITTGSVAGGSATAYVNGPLTRTIPNNAAAGNYRFPVGKNAYQLMEFASLTTGGTGTGTVTVEAFDVGPYTATAGTGLSAVNTDKYWSLTASLGSVTIDASSTIRLTEASLGSFSKVSQSTNATGTYNSIGGLILGSTVTSASPFDQSTLSAGTYFRVGTAADFSAGNYAIGPQASYSGYVATFPSMTAAVGAITNVPLLGHMLFEFQSDYVPSVETYPITLTPSIFNDATKTVTFRPAANVGSLIIFSSTGTVLSNTGADYIIIDGRNGGTGTNRFLKFTSTSTTVAAVAIGTTSTNNQFLYCQFNGSTSAASTGVFTVGSGSNSYLTLDHCDFDGSGSANNCFFATAALPNVTISYSNFFDYRNGSGVNLPAGSNNPVIDNNNFYQTMPYNGIAGTTYGINVIGITNGTISNNNIGGSGPALTGTWTVTSTTPAAYNFMGINATSLTTSTINNNKIQNFDWKCTVATWTGINAGGTSGSIGTDGANYIGSNTGNDNIKITYYATGSAQIYGINISGNGGNVACENNIIGSITTLLSGVTATSSSFTGIYSVNWGVINNNIIGSATTPLSINLAAQSTAGTAQNVIGIYFPIYSTGAINITNNAIANINNGSSMTNGVTRGILVPNNGSSVNISSNSIFSISTSQAATGVGVSGSLTGILMQSNAASGVVISGNQVYDLFNTAGAAAVTVDGICYSGSSAAINKIEKNLIHSFKTASATAVQNGIHLYQGFCSTENNVIRLGIDKNGSPLTSTAQINGMTKTSSAAGTFNFFFNTVYIGGSGVAAGAITTRAFNLATHSNEDIRNNIFVNARTNAVANPTNYALWLPASDPSNFTCDYNIYNVSATDGRLARVGAVDLTNIGALQAVFPGNDLNSGFGDPSLTNPAAAMATMSLVPLNNTPAEGTGIAIGSATVDFTGAARSGLTPTDIGAYAGNFTPPGAGQDIFFPVINYTPLLNTGLITNRTTLSFANITDDFTGVNTTAGTMPRLYFKKSTDANAFVGNTSADNGWKWVEANNSTSPFDFTIDYTIINGGSVVIGDVIQYFVVAQDQATTPNVSFNPSNGASGTSVSPSGMTAPAVPNNYGIVPTIASAVDVGTGYTYPTLTGAGGLFASINAGVINTNVVATVRTNTTEPGTYGLNLIIEEGPNAGTLTLTIQSDGVSHVLAGTMSPLTTPLILFNGACRVTIDGGSKFLTFRNANATYNTTGPVMQFQNGSQNCTVTQCIFESNSYGPASGEIVLGTTGINSVTITNNDFRDNRGTTPGPQRCCIYSNSANNSLTITNNNLYNFRANIANDPPSYGIYLAAVANGCIITGNSFYMESGITPVCPQQVIYIAGGNSHNISGNFIGGAGPGCTGTWTSTLSTYAPTYGIYFTGGTAPASTIQGNTISGFNLGGSGTFAAIQINAGVANVIGNTIGSATVADAIRYSGTSSLLGLYNTVPTGVCNFDGNTIANITFTNASGVTGIRAMMMYGGNIRKNRIYNIGSLNAASSPTIYGIWNAGGITANDFSNNLIALNGGNSNNPALFGFYDVSTTAGAYGFYFNSINIYGTAAGAATTYAFYRGNSAVYTVKSNILSNRRTGSGTHYAIFSNSAASLTSDYNDLYTAGAAFGSFGGSAKPDMATWQAIPQDLNSVNVDPAFVSDTDLHTVVPELNNGGQSIAGIIDDLSSVTRSNPPDIGVYEFTLLITSINTLAATSIGQYTVTLNGDINTNNELVNITFEYGETLSYGSSAPGVPAPVRSLTTTPVSANVVSLLPGTLYHYRFVGTSATSAEVVYGTDMTFTTLPPDITLNLTLFFEGLYAGSGTMNQAWNAIGPQFGPGVADVISVDLHDAVTFSTIHYTVNNVQVGTDGTATVMIPPSFNGSYYISVHHRNSIETITGSPVNFSGSTVNYNFTTSASQAFGNNMKQMVDGNWALYGGDANTDESIDGLDLIDVENSASLFDSGYILTDVNGDGVVDGFDLILVENNSLNFISIITP